MPLGLPGPAANPYGWSGLRGAAGNAFKRFAKTMDLDNAVHLVKMGGRQGGMKQAAGQAYNYFRGADVGRSRAVATQAMKMRNLGRRISPRGMEGMARSIHPMFGSRQGFSTAANLGEQSHLWGASNQAGNLKRASMRVGTVGAGLGTWGLMASSQDRG